MTLTDGTPHTVHNEGTADAIALVVHAPGGPMESFCRAVAALSTEAQADMTAVLDIAARSGIELLGPVPALS